MSRLIAAGLLLSSFARAELDPPASAAAADPPAPLVHPAVAQVAGWVPGLVVHGSGVLLQGRRSTATRLLLLEGASLLTAVGGAALLATTGAADETVWAGAYLGAVGVSGLGASTLANLYATLAPPRGWGRPQLYLPLLRARVGYARVEDPAFAHRNFSITGLELNHGSVRAGFSLWHAPGQDNQLGEASLAYRFLGPEGFRGRLASDGSFLEPRLSYTQHRFSAAGFGLQTADLLLTGRMDSQLYLPDVRGAFFELAGGYARQWIEYDLPGVSELDATSLLLMRMAFGIYLPSFGSTAGGELSWYYDHRHDGLAAGFKNAGVGSGPAGHFGMALSYRISKSIGVELEGQVGSAWVWSSALVYRVDPNRGDAL